MVTHNKDKRISEKQYHKIVLGWLEDSFVQVDYEPRLDSGREPDFIAYTPFSTYVIEVENDFESIKSGIGQAVMYSGETGHNPIVVFPHHTIEEPEYSYILKESPVNIIAL